MIEEWLGLQKAAITARIDLISEADLKALRSGALAILSKEAPSREAALQQLGEALRRATDARAHDAVAPPDTQESNA